MIPVLQKTTTAGIRTSAEADFPCVIEKICEITHMAVEHPVTMLPRDERDIPALLVRATISGRGMD